MDFNQLPIGLGMAFAANTSAMERFSAMTDDEKQEFVERSWGAMSKREMEDLVSSLAKDDEEPEFHPERIKNLFDGPSIG